MAQLSDPTAQDYMQTQADDANDQDTGESQDQNAPIGSQATGYAPPEDGPFACSNCVHFDGNSSCSHPKVQADPEVRGKVDAQGCCNYFRNGESDQGQGPDELKQAIAQTHPFGMGMTGMGNA